MNSDAEPVNRLTSSYTDPVTHTPAYKETSVQMTVLERAGRRIRCRGPIRATAIRRRRREWKWSASGSGAATITSRAMGWCRFETARNSYHAWTGEVEHGTADCFGSRTARSARRAARGWRKRPAQHAEALLGCYELIEQVHDAGVFQVLRGALSAGGKMVETAVEARRRREAIRALRNAIILARCWGAINPELLQCFANAVGETLGSAKSR